MRAVVVDELFKVGEEVHGRGVSPRYLGSSTDPERKLDRSGPKPSNPREIAALSSKELPWSELSLPQHESITFGCRDSQALPRWPR